MPIGETSTSKIIESKSAVLSSLWLLLRPPRALPAPCSEIADDSVDVPAVPSDCPSCAEPESELTELSSEASVGEIILLPGSNDPDVMECKELRELLRDASPDEPSCIFSGGPLSGRAIPGMLIGLVIKSRWLTALGGVEGDVGGIAMPVSAESCRKCADRCGDIDADMSI